MLCVIVNKRKHLPQSILLQPLTVHCAAHPSVEIINSLFVLSDPHDYYIVITGCLATQRERIVMN